MGKLAAIRRAGSYMPCHIRKLLYQAFILPHLDNCSVVWNGCGATLSKHVERIKNNIIMPSELNFCLYMVFSVLVCFFGSVFMAWLFVLSFSFIFFLSFPGPV